MTDILQDTSYASSGTKGERGVLTIAELSLQTGVRPTTIHYYLKQGLLPRPYKAGASRSLYSQEHAAILRTIRELKADG